jgi:hypothetical protein
MKGDRVELYREIKGLKADRDFWAKTARAYKDDYNEVIRTGKCSKGLWVTYKVIDRAVDFIENLFSTDDHKYGLGIIEVAKSHMWQVLNLFNIFRCEECGGFGEVGVPHVPTHKTCPNCNGHRWVIGGDDE